MFRLLGFFAGSVAAIFALFTLIGTPSFQLTGDGDDDRFRVAVQQLKDKQSMPPDSEPAETAQTDADREAVEDATPQAPLPTVADEVPGPETVAAPEGSNDREPVEDNLGASEITDRSKPMDDLLPPAVADNGEPVWQPFWNPFRSELAAEGFVRRLENVTGLDYRVERVKNGVYEVAFSYYNDDERDAYLAQIASATGLDLSGALR